jgi:hypothetical protein
MTVYLVVRLSTVDQQMTVCLVVRLSTVDQKMTVYLVVRLSTVDQKMTVYLVVRLSTVDQQMTVYLVVRLSTVDQQMTVHLSMAMAVMEKEEMRTNTAYTPPILILLYCCHIRIARNSLTTVGYDTEPFSFLFSSSLKTHFTVYCTHCRIFYTKSNFTSHNYFEVLCI